MVEKREEDEEQRRATKCGGQAKKTKKHTHSLQKINEDTEQLDIWYTVSLPECAVWLCTSNFASELTFQLTTPGQSSHVI